MNISVIQTMASMNVGNTPQVGKSVGTAASGTANSFGSVFGSLAANTPVAVPPVPTQSGNQIPDEAVLAIFNATSVEALGQALQAVVGYGGNKDGETVLPQVISAETQKNIDPIILNPEMTIDVPVAESETNQKPLMTAEELIPFIQHSSLSDIAEAIGIQSEQFVENLQALLKKANISETELEKLSSETGDLWQMINIVDKVAPQFFEQLSDALSGKGEIPKQQAVELLAMLKAVTLLAPKTDLILKQEQQLFSLENYLNLAGERFENVLNSNTTNKNSMVQLVDGRQGFRFNPTTTTNQPMTDSGNEDSNAGQSDVRKESAQSAISNGHAPLAAKGEFKITELTNSGTNRSETLLREMQAIMKRANFGQVGGTNRLLIKLYPEHLGQVRIELLETNGIMTARILASTALGKEMLDSQQAQLRQAFAQQNIQLDRLDISQTIQESNRGERDQNAFNGQFKREQQQSEEQQQQSGEDEMSFQEFMIELEV
ncbi:flagellar hook-length control protein [Bacillus sp. OxB-1]|nr:flagellar hook-length control protein [Bacillus sp. OxB-1]